MLPSTFELWFGDDACVRRAETVDDVFPQLYAPYIADSRLVGSSFCKT